MKVIVRLFAKASDLAGQNEVALEFPSQTSVSARTLREQLGRDVPALTPLLPHLLIAVNEDYAHAETAIQQGDSVACFPPVSGG